MNLDGLILHTVMHYSSTCTYKPNFIEIEETFGGRTDGRKIGKDGHFSTHVIRSTQRSRPKTTRLINCLVRRRPRGGRPGFVSSEKESKYFYYTNNLNSHFLNSQHILCSFKSQNLLHIFRKYSERQNKKALK